MPNAPRLATAMRYRDVEAAVDWLCRAFGFEKQAQSTSDTGEVIYAQLGYGNAVLMLAPVRNTATDQFMKQPDEIGGAETQSCYFAVADADVHWARAKEAGASIVLELQDDDAGGRGYSCRDPEGHIWSFGTHDPTIGVHADQPEERPPPTASRGRALAAVVGVAILLATGAAIWTDAASWRPGLLSSTARQAHGGSGGVKVAEPRIDETAERAAREAREELERERDARRVAEEARGAARDELDRALAEKSAALRASEETLSRAAEAQRAKSVAEQDAQGAREELERTRAAKVASDQASEAAQQRLADQDAANKSAGAALERVRQQLAEAERAREAAERTAKEALERAQQLTDAQQGARETADRTAKEALAPVQRQLAEAQSEREAAERSAKEAREQLTREQSAKNAAWRANAQLRRQLGPGPQAASETGAAANDSATAAGGPPRARPKGKAKSSEPAE
jgi:uncharacterized glyoxalase superfamily protein PhnB